MDSFYYYSTKIGKILITGDEQNITGLYFGESFKPSGELNESVIIKQAYDELCAYLDGELTEFTLPLKPAGTPFQLKVWEALRNIPYGKTKTYKDIAQEIGAPKAFRAVGGANNKNPIAVIIPCHRVIGADGSLTGYGGGMDIKESLLRLEGCII